MSFGVGPLQYERDDRMWGTNFRIVWFCFQMKIEAMPSNSGCRLKWHCSILLEISGQGAIIVFCICLFEVLRLLLVDEVRDSVQERGPITLYEMGYGEELWLNTMARRNTSLMAWERIRSGRRALLSPNVDILASI